MPPWEIVEGGTERCMDVLIRQCPNAKNQVETPVVLDTSAGHKVISPRQGEGYGKEQVFDQVVRAWNGDQAPGNMGKYGIVAAETCTFSGSHEDLFTSGMNAGLRFNAEFVWESTARRVDRGIPVQGWRDYFAMILISFAHILVMIWEGIFGGMVNDKTDVFARRNQRK